MAASWLSKWPNRKIPRAWATAFSSTISRGHGSRNSHLRPQRLQTSASLATFRCKNRFFKTVNSTTKLFVVGDPCKFLKIRSSLRRCPRDIDQILRNHPKSDPSFHPMAPFVPTSEQTMPSLEHTYPSLRSHAPLLRPPKPSLPLVRDPGRRPRVFVRYRHLLDTRFFCSRLILRAVESGIGRNQLRRAIKDLFVFLDRGHEDRLVGRAFFEDLVVGHDLILRFLDLSHLPELRRLGRLALSDRLRRGFKDAQELPLEMSVSLDDPRLGLLQNSARQLTDFFQLPRQRLHDQIALPVRSLLDPLPDFVDKGFGLRDYLARDSH